TNGSYMIDPTQSATFENAHFGTMFTDSFNYTVIDNHGDAATGVATINFTVPAEPVSASPFTVTLPSEDVIDSTEPSLLTHAMADPDDSISSVVNITSTTGNVVKNGNVWTITMTDGLIVTVNANGTYTIDPTKSSAFEVPNSGNFTDSFTFTVQ